MCGLAGIAGVLPADPHGAVQSMLRTMPYRGPNDQGVWTDDQQVSLGHLRLSIIDLSAAGHQPMWSTDKRFALVFNGEIYNYKELRPGLEALGSRFGSQTDSEVIIEAYRHFGQDCVQQFNGMWAFALWDTAEQTLFLSRDRFGVKPLFYTWDGATLRFASEMKALLTQQLADPNWNYYYHFFDRRTPLGCDQTVLKNIVHLRPSHSLTLQSGRLTTVRYWQANPGYSRSNYDYREPVQQVRSLVDSAVDLRLRSDVPVGICLSGGVDSSVIAVALRNKGITPVTFSSVYQEPKYSEETFMHTVIDHVGAQSHFITPKPQDFFAVMEQIVHHHDEPVRMPGTYSHWHVMQCAQGHVIVLLDGQGGDEVFGGYDTYYSSYIASLLRDTLALKAPIDALQQIHQCLQELKTYHGQYSSFLLEALARALPPTVRSLFAAEREREALFTHDFLTDYSRPMADNAQELKLKRSMPSLLDQEMYTTFIETNLPMLLRYEDRNSMAFSLEARVPLLDYRVVEYALGLSYRYKMQGYNTKYVLREAYKDLLPPTVYNRKDKKGFPTPVAEWFKHQLFAELRERLLQSKAIAQNIVDRSKVEQLLLEHQTGYKNHERTLFRLLTLSMWLKHYS